MSQVRFLPRAPNYPPAMNYRFLTLITLVAVAACSNSDSGPTTTFTAPPIETTTSFIPNPFLDVSEERSNFANGDPVDIIGLPMDDPAWVGSFPAEDQEFFGGLWEFDRLDAGMVSTGEAASYLGGLVWEQVGQPGKETGYVLQQNTGVLGTEEDLTPVVAELEAASADELIELVAGTIAASDGLEPIQITRREFGGREVYFDLIGADAETTRGRRIRVVVEEEGEAFRVVLVESWTICTRGVDATGLCV